MSSHDLAISNVPYQPNAPAKWKHPPHVIVLTDGEKKISKFITTGKLDFLSSFVQIRGFFTEATDEEIHENFLGLTEAVEKEKIVEIYFPIHRIISIKSLIYRAQ